MQNSQKTSLFFYINFLFSSVLVLLFLYHSSNHSVIVDLFLILGAISTTATIYLIIYIISRLFFRFKVTCIILGAIFFLINFALVADFIIYKVWSFHINAMVINIITSPSAYDSLYITTSTKTMVISILVSLILIEVFICRYIFRVDSLVISKRVKLFNKRVIPTILALVVTEKLLYGISDILAKREILESVKVIPLYQPLTFSKLANKFGIEKRGFKEQKNSINSTSNIIYPKKEMKIDSSSPTPNIFIVIFDAVREDMIDIDITPNISNFSDDALVFKRHISGGDATRFGFFSLMYGLNSTYWFNFLAAKKEPVLFKILKQRDYQIGIFSSTDTRWPEFRETVYKGVTDCIVDDHKGDSAQKDKKSVDSFIQFLDKQDTDKPIFSLLFLDAPHGYFYPKEFEKFKPNYGNSGLDYINVDKDSSNRIKNSQKNAIYYDDKLFGDIVKVLKDKGLYENSIIIFTSDHGEEFFEYGSFGHNSSFSNAQVNSPFIMKLPDNRHKEITKMTSHLDVVPTLLNIIGVKNLPNQYSNGSDLLSPSYKREFCYIAKWNKNAIYTDKFTYIFSNYPNEIFKSEVRENSSYKKVSKKDAPNINKILLKVLEDNRKFLK